MNKKINNKNIIESISPYSIAFLKNYSAFNCHMRREQTKPILEKYDEIDSLSIDEKNKDIRKAFYALDIISKAGMASEDLAILCLSLQNGVKGLEKEISKKTNPNLIEKFYNDIESKNELWFDDILAKPKIEKEVVLSGEEKLFLTKTYEKNSKALKKVIQKTREFRKIYKYAFLKMRHGNPIYPSVKPVKINETKLYLSVALTTKNKKVEYKKIIFNDKIVHNTFLLICQIQETMRAITMNHVLKYSFGSHKIFSNKLHNFSGNEIEKIKELDKKLLNKYKNIMGQLSVPIEFKIKNKKELQEKIKFLEEELQEQVIFLPKEYNFPLVKIPREKSGTNLLQSFFKLLKR